MKTEKVSKVAEDTKDGENLETVEAVKTLEIPETSEKEITGESEIKTYHLITDFTLILHTASVHSIFTGKWKPGQMGLVQFAKQIELLIQGVEKDDPYAEWQLLKIHDAIQSLKKIIQEQGILWRKQFRSLKGVQTKPFKNPNPFNVSINSVGILVLMVGSLIAQIDYITRLMLLLRQLGIVPVGEMLPNMLCEEIQKIFTLSQGWKQTGITREDIFDNNSKSQKAEEQFGKLPEDILYQKISLPFLQMDE